ncbi:hypothetical protein BO70DRAFT_321036 [Aspergillus heteromorphus CBS 117.55]|uniref:Altered inheritance of mitochondria protein 6 n=1 Tax=Aspergillus heteromorphus CBS 117.55 TaxID=1448321 RepID=A0A317VE18_9EURO|nr:uncharacterized protein BO70DRAFT_321036 [Aspergillus heteromorphus CBS 117.55]PWY71679.1 hypothetical protein BO70DRAFT_321036 [Aspergillus heteromorphus CBS 117.55]
MAAATEREILDLTATKPPVKADEYDEYSWVLLEDHPLRSHPTQCCPGLLWLLQRFCAAVRRRWSDRVLSLICLFLMFLVAIQFLSLLPYGVSYLFLHDEYKEQAGFVHWPAEFNDQPPACISYNPHAHVDAVQYSVAAGCTGVKADVWLQRDSLLVGSSIPILKEESTLRSVYVEPLLEQLHGRNAADARNDQSQMTSRIGLFEQDPMQQFTLFLEVRSPLQTVWPCLVSQLVSLSEHGYLSYRNGTQVVPGPVTVVLSGGKDLGLDDHQIISQDSLYDSIFFDEPLSPETAVHGSLEDEQDPASQYTQPPRGEVLSHSVSVNFGQAIGSPHRGRFSRQQVELVKSQVRAAHELGLPIRYEGIPCYSEGMRRIIWRILTKNGADLIEVDWTGCASRGWQRFFNIGRDARSSHKRPHIPWPWGTTHSR